MLRITVHDNPRVVRLQLEGTLSGPWLQELHKCWRNTMAIQPRPRVIIDLTGVTFVDNAAKVYLIELHRQHAEFVAADCLMKAVVDEITEESSSERSTQEHSTPLSEDE